MIKKPKQFFKKVILTLIFIGIIQVIAIADDREFPYWELGAGLWTSVKSPEQDALDYARWDWLLLCNVGGEQGTKSMSRKLMLNYYRLNPRQKVLVRIWPIRTADTFVDFEFNPKMRERINNRIIEQVNTFKTLPNIWGYCFVEEIPGHFGRWRGLKVLPSFVKRNAAAIKKEYGKELVWNYDLRKFLMQKYWVPAIRKIHAMIKKADGQNRPILWWHKGGTQGNNPDGKPTYPFADAQIIDKKTCDGYMSYCASPHSWFQQFISQATEKKWGFLTQLSYPDFMRSTPWQFTVKTVQAPIPGNLGYFYFNQSSGGGNRFDKFARKISGKAGLKYRRVQPFKHPQKGNVIKFTSTSLGLYDNMFIQSYAKEKQPRGKLAPGSLYIPVKPGDTLTYSFWLESEKTEGNEGFTFLVVPVTKEQVRRRPHIAAYREKFGPGKKGRIVRGTFKLPSYCHFIWANIGLRDAKGTVYLDDFSLKGSDGKELMQYGSFEKVQFEPEVKLKGWVLSDNFALKPIMRNFCNEQRIGNDVVYRYFNLAVELTAKRIKADKIILTAKITNTKNPDYYYYPELAVARDIYVGPVLTPGTKNKTISTPKQELAPGESTSAQIEMTVPAGKPYHARIIVTSKNTQTPTAPGFAELIIKPEQKKGKSKMIKKPKQLFKKIAISALVATAVFNTAAKPEVKTAAKTAAKTVVLFEDGKSQFKDIAKKNPELLAKNEKTGKTILISQKKRSEIYRFPVKIEGPFIININAKEVKSDAKLRVVIQKQVLGKRKVVYAPPLRPLASTEFSNIVYNVSSLKPGTYWIHIYRKGKGEAALSKVSVTGNVQGLKF